MQSQPTGLFCRSLCRRWIIALIWIAAGSAAEAATREQVEAEVERLTRTINETPQQASAYVKRGDAFFALHEFDKSVADYTQALRIDDKQDRAYLGRGMALGRAGEVERGIRDISVYLQRHPDDSYALTKRGVRYLWIGKVDQAYDDLSRAVKLNDSNAEAHDDLGVIYSQRKQYDTAIHHFNSTISTDPSYQKAYHNIAIAYYLTSRNAEALAAVDKSLLLRPDNRMSMLLKAVILDEFGRHEEAQKIRDDAEMVQDGNWSEQMVIK